MTKEQFTEAVLALQPTLYRVTRTQLRIAADCEDAVQETLRRAWEKRDRLREPSALRAWLIRILLNVCRDIQREHRRQIPVEQLPDRPQQAGEHLLMDALMTLPPKYRAVIILHHAEGFEVAEMAHMLGIPQGTVKSRLARGRYALEKAYEKEALTE